MHTPYPHETGATAADGHDECQLLVPWFVNGTLSESQRQRVETHLARCASCRAEVAEQSLLREHMGRHESVVYTPQASLQKLLSRIDSEPTEPRAVLLQPASGVATSQRWLVAAAVLSAIAVMTAGLSWWRMQDERMAPRYMTLTSESDELAHTPAARVVFAPAANVARVSELLRRHHARIVAGPTEAGVYTLTFMSADTASAVDEVRSADAVQESVTQAPTRSLVESSIDALRKEPDVLFAESVLTGSAAP
jgi:anti-sigma factor RsiW